MSRQQTYATTWQPMVDHEPFRIVPDYGRNPVRGILIAIPISAALWTAVGSSSCCVWCREMKETG